MNIFKICLNTYIHLNKFEKFIQKHLDKPWHWGQCDLSQNPSITIQFIEKHLDKD